MKNNIILILSFVFFLNSNGQVTSRNGQEINTQGQYNVFLVFVHLENHPDAWQTSSTI